MQRVIFTATTVLCVSTVTLADTINVGPGESIQSAIDTAVEGDAIIVAPGIYPELLNFHGKAVTVRSSNGPEVTVVDADGLGDAAVTCRSGEGLDSVLDGFTVTGGTGRSVSGKTFGGGMYVKLANPTVTNCIFTGNTADAGGGLALVSVSYGVVSDCRFIDNTATAGGSYGGAGVYMQGSYSEVRKCSFEQNRAVGAAKGGGMKLFLGQPKVTNCLFFANEARHGGGIMNENADPTITGCTFSANSAVSTGGGMRCVYDSSITAVSNCIFWGNTAGVDGDEILDQAGAVTTVEYSTVSGGWFGAGSNNSADDPMFANAADGNLRLTAASPCIDAGTNAAVTVDHDLDGNARIYAGGVVDLGAYESQLSNSDPCPSDLDDNGMVDFEDLITLAAHWGSCEGCDADLDGDDAVDFDDMLALMLDWGPCP